MKKYLKFIGVGLLSFTLLVGCSDKSTKTLASIDDQKITYGDFIKEMAMYKLQLDSTIGTDVWRKVYILEYVITLLQLISTVNTDIFCKYTICRV